MTNAEKYLKEGATIKEFAVEITKQISRWDELSYYSNNIENDIIDFLSTETKPTLTEDERVILRNIDRKEYYYIGRADDITDNLYLLNDSQGRVDIDMYNHLFQFIKEGEEYNIEELLK